MAYPSTSKTTKSTEGLASISPSRSIANPAVDAKRQGKSSFSALKGVVTLVVILVVIGGLLYLVGNYTNIKVPIFSRGVSSQWQAVFLTNGQVYFGKVVKITKRIVVLRDIYYLQIVTQPGLQRSQEVGETIPSTPPEQRLTLIKLGNELHGPKDEMTINRDHVVLIEGLKDDSRVVQAINRYLEEQQGR